MKKMNNLQKKIMLALVLGTALSYGGVGYAESDVQYVNESDKITLAGYNNEAVKNNGGSAHFLVENSDVTVTGNVNMKAAEEAPYAFIQVRNGKLDLQGTDNYFELIDNSAAIIYNDADGLLNINGGTIKTDGCPQYSYCIDGLINYGNTTINGKLKFDMQNANYSTAIIVHAGYLDSMPASVTLQSGAIEAEKFMNSNYNIYHIESVIQVSGGTLASEAGTAINIKAEDFAGTVDEDQNNEIDTYNAYISHPVMNPFYGIYLESQGNVDTKGAVNVALTGNNVAAVGVNAGYASKVKFAGDTDINVKGNLDLVPGVGDFIKDLGNDLAYDYYTNRIIKVASGTENDNADDQISSFGPETDLATGLLSQGGSTIECDGNTNIKSNQLAIHTISGRAYVNEAGGKDVNIEGDLLTEYGYVFIPDIDTNSLAEDPAEDTVNGLNDGKFGISANLDKAGSSFTGATIMIDKECYLPSDSEAFANDDFVANHFFHPEINTGFNSEINLSFTNGAVWNMTKDSEMTHLVNSSLINMRHTGDSTDDVLYVESLKGKDGVFAINTDLQKSADYKNVYGAGDKIIIGKNVAEYPDEPIPPTPPTSPEEVPDVQVMSLAVAPELDIDVPVVDNIKVVGDSEGNFILDIKDASFESGEQADGYLLLVEDRTNGKATFTGKEIDRGGIYKYKPVITNVNPDEAEYALVNPDATNWYLTGFEKSGESNGAKSITDLSNSRYVNYLMDHDTLLKRLGELRMVQQNEDEDNNGIWARFRKGSMTTDALDGSFKTYQLGYDKEITPERRYVGAAISHTDSTYNGSVASGEGDMTALTIYDTWLGEKNHYFDFVAKAGRMHGDSTYSDARYPEKGSYKTMYYSISGEYGRKNINEDGYYYEPQAQLTLGRINGDDYVTSRGTEVHQNAVNSVLGRLGVTFGREFAMDKPEKHSNVYAKVNLLHEFAGHSKATMTDTFGDSLAVSKDYGGTWLNVGVGATANIGKSTNLYFDFEKNFGGEVKSNWIGQAGIRVSW